MDENTWLWTAQGILAAIYGMAGTMKVMRSELPGAPEAMAANQVRLLGIAEIAGAIAMVLPIALDILPWLTPLAAIGFIAIQVLAIGFHVRRNEYQVLPVNLVLAALAVFVLVGRWELF